MDYLNMEQLLNQTIESLTDYQKTLLIKRMLIAKAKRELSAIDKWTEKEYIEAESGNFGYKRKL